MNQLKQKLIEAAGRLRTVSREVAIVPGMQAQATSMLERAERLEANRFTVALFGAFSAGKSSFANALMGEMVLPVSPNPTTAAINKIMPPTDEFPHGTVRVVLKTQEAIESDVLRSLAIFSIHADNLASGLKEVERIDVSQIAPNAKPHYTFLKAVTKGFAEMGGHIGGELIVDMTAFKGFVAKEEKACFAEYIELYFSCPLTDQGIVLVDTPGADSINARHTGVAFDYMKNADVVLFVTYYNHAFAQADREFLLQMGRVKDSFEMDKMFFLVNACDLAASEEELAGVLEHVGKNLLQCGIRHPRIYPVSSQTAMLARLHAKGKLAGSSEKVYRQRLNLSETDELLSAEQALAHSGLTAFEQDFMRYTLGELTEVAVTNAFAEMKRAHATLGEFIQMAQADVHLRAEKRQAASDAKAAAVAAIHALSVASEERDLVKEREELLYYVKQRLFFRFNELFAYAFNPSVLKEDGRNMKQALQSSLQDLLRMIGYDLAQELRATSLRLEKFLNKCGARLTAQWAKETAEYAPGLTLAAYAYHQVETPTFNEELSPQASQSLQKPLGLFKNSKDFFEQNGKTKMRDEMEKLLQEPVAQFIAAGGDLLATQIAEAFAAVVEAERNRVIVQVDEYFTGVFAALDATLDLADLQARQQRIGAQIM